MNHKFYRFHQLFRFSRIKVPQIVLIVLIQPFEIFLQSLPPFIYCTKLCVFHFAKLIQAPLQTDKEVCGQISRLKEQIFQTHSQALNFNSIFRHRISVLLIFVIGYCIYFSRILYRRKIFPLYQCFQIQKQLLHGICFKFLIFFYEPEYILFV